MNQASEMQNYMFLLNVIILQLKTSDQKNTFLLLNVNKNK